MHTLSIRCANDDDDDDADVDARTARGESDARIVFASSFVRSFVRSFVGDKNYASACEGWTNIALHSTTLDSASTNMAPPPDDDDGETWQVYVHKLRAWVPSAASVTDETAEPIPTRPYLILIVSAKDGAFLSHEHDEGERGNVFVDEPTCEEVVDFVAKTIEAPRVLNSSRAKDGTGKEKRGKPSRVRLACTTSARAKAGEPKSWATYDGCKYVGGCKEGLKEKCGIDDVEFAPVPRELIETIVRGQIEPSMAPQEQAWGTQHLPGLMESVDGFTSTFGASLFGAAKEFVACEPWKALERRRPVKVSYRLTLRDDLTMRLTAFVSVDGDLDSENLGFTVHKTLTNAQAAYEVEHGNEDVEASVEGQTCMFASAPETPFEDIDAAELYEWPVVPSEKEIGGALWPLFFKIGLDEETGDNLEISRPAIIELQCFEVALKAVTSLVAKGDLKCVGEEDNQRAAAGPWTVEVSSFAAKGEEEKVEIEISLPELVEMKPVEYL